MGTARPLLNLRVRRSPYGAPRPCGRGTYYCSAESAEAFQEPAFAKATAGPSDAFIPGLYARGLLRRRITFF
jgi:hypothetical protein